MIDYNFIRERIAKAKKAVLESRSRPFSRLLPSTELFVLDALNDAALLIDRCQKSDECSKAGPIPKEKESFGDSEVAAELLKVKVKALNLSPGDLVVLTTPNALSLEAVKAIEKIFESACSVPDIRVIVLTEGVKIGHVVKSCQLHSCCPACNAPHSQRVPLARIIDGLQVWPN